MFVCFVARFLFGHESIEEEIDYFISFFGKRPGALVEVVDEQLSIELLTDELGDLLRTERPCLSLGY